MGKEIRSEWISLDETENLKIANAYDPLPIHTVGKANLLLPPCYSGLYVIAKINNAILNKWPRILGGTELNIRYNKPITFDVEKLFLWIEFDDSPTGKVNINKRKSFIMVYRSSAKNEAECFMVIRTVQFISTVEIKDSKEPKDTKEEGVK
jgi:hypothetical protein